MKKQTLEKQIVDFLKDRADLNTATIINSFATLSELGFDWVQTIELVLELESKYNVDISTSPIDCKLSVGADTIKISELVDAIFDKLGPDAGDVKTKVIYLEDSSDFGLSPLQPTVFLLNSDDNIRWLATYGVVVDQSYKVLIVTCDESIAAMLSS